ncbi:hypothetical protein G7066_00735 [Leucobacter coleopterorum]|uniref:Peptidase n=1 Tax=Leucobacter coleopterorum TaxID=2714933 RepID=A0ABX6JVL1_9MICO|nr:hypothetical protein [Leucobacter coleopterorum]QIM17603.1 hypothetical protein G7066_00735 [Leucobacter coleopterorum]
MDEADVAEVLVHEFTHSVQRATIGESELFSGGNARPAFIEGHATYVQHLFAGTTDEFTSDTVRSAVAGDLNWLLGANGGFADKESVNRAYLVAGAYFYYLANTDGNMSTFVREGVKEAGYNLPGVPLIDPYPHDQTSWKGWLATQ